MHYCPYYVALYSTVTPPTPLFYHCLSALKLKLNALQERSVTQYGHYPQYLCKIYVVEIHCPQYLCEIHVSLKIPLFFMFDIAPLLVHLQCGNI